MTEVKLPEEVERDFDYLERHHGMDAQDEDWQALARIRKALEEALSNKRPHSKEYLATQRAFLVHDLTMLRAGMRTVEWMMSRIEGGSYD